MTEEEAKDLIVQAAKNWDDVGGQADRWDKPWNQELHDAVAAYRKATAPPEPIELFVGRHSDRPLGGGGYSEVDHLSIAWDEVWRCTVTPIERVR